jgi:raffinose/stachyose/melibiose transport system substrate-binding protein
MCITGSYARGTIFMANPNINMGAFPIPNDTAESTPVLTGIDAALCVSASATPDQKKVALAFLEFLSRPANAQIFCDTDGAPSAMSGVVYSDPRIAPVTTKMQTGPVRDWFATFFPGNIQNSIYDEVQQLLMDKNAAAFLDRLDNTIRLGAQ